VPTEPWGVTPSSDWQTKVEHHLRRTFLAGSRFGVDAERKLQERMRMLVERAGIRKRVDQDALVLILRDGFIKTLFELMPAVDDWRFQLLPERRRIEEEIFDGYRSRADRHVTYGYPVSQRLPDPLLQPEPIDGYMDGLSGYGDVVLVLRRDRFPNITVTLSDSGGTTLWATRPEMAASDLRRASWTSARRQQGPKTLSVDEVIDTERIDQSGAEYAEVQIHQTVRVEDIERAIVLGDLGPQLSEHLRTAQPPPFEVLGRDGAISADLLS
jgi:hypothetical protein